MIGWGSEARNTRALRSLTILAPDAEGNAAPQGSGRIIFET